MTRGQPSGEFYAARLTHDLVVVDIPRHIDDATRAVLGTADHTLIVTTNQLHRRSGRPWSYKTVLDTLLNPVDIGTVHFRDITVDDAHPAIIDRDTFALAQEIITERGEHPAKSAGVGSDYHLTGKIRCPQCGQAYLGTTATGKLRTYRYYTCFTRNRYGSSRCDAPRLQADLLDQTVLAAVGDFYHNHTHLLIEAVNAARDEHRATLAAAHAELKTVRAQIAQKEATVDNYFTDYETNKIDKVLLERRIAKLADELTRLRRRRDQLQVRIDDTPEEVTPQQAATLGEEVHHIINYGTDTERKQLCELLIEELKINPATATATPTFRVNLTAPRDVKNTESPPASNLTKGQKPSSRGVRERRPPVEVMTRYSNNPTLLDDLRHAREVMLPQDDDDEPELGGQRRASGRRWAIAHRLTAEDVQAVVNGYRAGRTARELAERFSVSESSVKRLVRRAGSRKRGLPQTADLLAC